MRRVRVPLSGLRQGPCELSREASHYLCSVHRLEAGAVFVAFDVEQALEAEGTLTRVARGRAECDLGTPRAALRGGIGVSLLQGASKGDRLDEVVRAATALGADSVGLVLSERSVVRPGEARMERLKSVAVEAARQSGRGDIPRLDAAVDLNTALTAAASSSLRLCLAPSAELPLAECLSSWDAGAHATLLIGPEGGLSDAEVERAVGAGFLLAALGRLTLRTELAAVAALGCFAGRRRGR